MMDFLLTVNAPPPLLATAGGVLFLLLPILGSILLTYGVFQAIMETRASSQKKVKERLRGGSSSKTEQAVNDIIRRNMSDDKSFAHAALGKLSFIPKLQTMLDQADIHWSAAQTILNLCGLALLATMVLAVLGISLVAAIGCGAAILLLPLMYISMRRKKRMVSLTNQLPDVFELMSQALRAGHSLAGAIQLIQEQLPPPIATEFALVYQEQNLGMRIEDALLEMADRVDSLDVRFFVTAVLIQRQTGGDLAEVLDKIGSLIRQRIELQGMVRGLTAEGRLSGWVLFALPIVVFVATLALNPEYAGGMINDPAGKIMLIVAGGMQLMGLAMIRWIVNIKI